MIATRYQALLTRRAGPGRFLRRSVLFVREVVAHTFGRGIADEIAIPPEVEHASARAKRLVRQARVSPW